jgi:hypothetical protein
MGGAVWYERRKGWTCFVVRVPLAVAAEAPLHREAFPLSAAASAGAETAGSDAFRTAKALRSHTRR